MALIELWEVNFDAESGAVSLTHFYIFILSVLTEGIFEDSNFV